LGLLYKDKLIIAGFIGYFVSFFYIALYQADRMSGQALSYEATWNMCAAGLFMVGLFFFVISLFTTYQYKEKSFLNFLKYNFWVKGIIFIIMILAAITLYYNTFNYTVAVLNDSEQVNLFVFYKAFLNNELSFCKITNLNPAYNFELLHRFCQFILYSSIAYFVFSVFVSIKDLFSFTKFLWLILLFRELYLNLGVFLYSKLYVGVPSVAIIIKSSVQNQSQFQSESNNFYQYAPEFIIIVISFLFFSAYLAFKVQDEYRKNK